MVQILNEQRRNKRDIKLIWLDKAGDCEEGELSCDYNQNPRNSQRTDKNFKSTS